MARYQERKRRIGAEHITPVGGNVFLDLGFAPDVAAKLKTEAGANIRSNVFG